MAVLGIDEEDAIAEAPPGGAVVVDVCRLMIVVVVVEVMVEGPGSGAVWMEAGCGAFWVGFRRREGGSCSCLLTAGVAAGCCA